MSTVRTFHLLVGAMAVCAMLACAACSDDDGGTNGAPDGSVPPDGTVPPDGSVPVDGSVPPPGTEWPVGIPYPEFGLDQTVESIHGDPDYCTHYVDNTVACDDGGPGTPSQPRCTIPNNLTAGDVVCILAGTYQLSSFWMDVSGTAQAPIFIRGPESGPRPVITTDGSSSTGGLGFDLRVDYLILEHLEFDQTRVLVEPGSSHVALRFCNVHDHPDRSGVSLRGDDIVVYQNEVHHYQGNNRVGVAGACGVARIWIVANHIHHNAEDSVQFGHGCDADRPNHIYVGANVMHSDRENAVDFKYVQDVVVSQNIMYGYRPAPTDQEFCFDDGSGCYPAGFYDSGSDGSAVVIGSDGDSRDVWLILNEIYDSQNAIRIEETSTTWIVGNILYDTLNAALVLEKRADALYLLNNTIHIADVGIWQLQQNFVLTADNNIFSLINGRTIDIDSATLASAATLRNNLFWNGGAAIEIRWSTPHTLTSDADFQALTLGTVENNLIADPLFTDPNQNDFLPASGSPAIDAGHPDAIQAACATFQSRYSLDICVDLDGTTRPQNATFDIGAFEQ